MSLGAINTILKADVILEIGSAHFSFKQKRVKYDFHIPM
jgi:hypothetical protein